METKRPTIPAAEEVLGGYFPVLDHGFVALVDYMGTDEDVERAARVSYGYGTRKVSQTRGLIRYLRRHAHTTPSEMVELKFHCAMPMFVARQWVRHRTACLAEGTEIYFDLPGGVRRRGHQLYKLKIEEIWDRFRPTENRTRPDKQRNPFFRRDRVRRMQLRQMDEDTGRVQHTRIVDVYRNGPKPVFKMVLADGKEITATADHRFRFAGGWDTVAGSTGLREVGGRAVWRPGEYYVHVNGLVIEAPPSYRQSIARWTTQIAPKIHAGNTWTCQLCGERARELHCHHVVPVWADESLAREESNLTTLCGTCHRRIAGRELDFVERLGGPPLREEWRPRPRGAWNKLTSTRLVRVDRFEYVGIRETYDLEVEGPYHNFIANGIVTHNSINEYSGRYSLMPLLFYKPELEHFALQSQSNQQGRREEHASTELYEQAIAHWERVREEAADGYRWMVGEDVARELARIDLPLSTYTQWYWKIDLHNLFHFLTLRADAHAQYEIQAFARVMAGILKRVAPLSYEAWIDYNVCGSHVSRAELEALGRLLEADAEGVRVREGAALSTAELQELGLSGREIRELLAKLGPQEVPDYELDLSIMKTAEEMAEKMHEAVPGDFE